MERSPSSEDVSCVATQGFPNILRNPVVHRRVRKTPSQVSILNQINEVHITPNYLPKIHISAIESIYVLVFLVVPFIMVFSPISYMQ
jgi:hypothetical protein